MMKLWLVKTGECIKTWEFTTAVKRVQWSEDDSKVRPLCLFFLFLLARGWGALARPWLGHAALHWAEEAIRVLGRKRRT